MKNIDKQVGGLFKDGIKYRVWLAEYSWLMFTLAGLVFGSVYSFVKSGRIDWYFVLLSCGLMGIMRLALSIIYYLDLIYILASLYKRKW